MLKCKRCGTRFFTDFSARTHRCGTGGDTTILPSTQFNADFGSTPSYSAPSYDSSPSFDSGGGSFGGGGASGSFD